MMLTFTGQKEEILEFIKNMTTRPDFKMYFYDAWCRGIRKLDMWWRNPRNHQPDCYKMGIVNWEDCERKLGVFLDDEDAHRDGFDSLPQYKRRLEQLNDMSWQDVEKHLWTLIKWKRSGWIEGPHQPTIMECPACGTRTPYTKCHECSALVRNPVLDRPHPRKVA